MTSDWREYSGFAGIAGRAIIIQEVSIVGFGYAWMLWFTVAGGIGVDENDGKKGKVRLRFWVEREM